MSKSQTNINKRKKALGRGLGALIPKQDASTQREYFNCSITRVHPNPAQPRKHFDPEALADLSASIKESGLIQPLVVRRVDGADEKYELIAGERRWRASKMAGLTEVPVVVKDVSDAIAFALALIENIQRQDLNPIEEALAYQRLIEEFEFKQADLAEQVGKSRAAVSNSVRLLNLPAEVQEHLAMESLTAGHARALLTLDDEDCVALAELIVERGATVRQAENWAKLVKDGAAIADLDAPVEVAPAEPVVEEAPEEPEQDEPEVDEEDKAPAFRDDAATKSIVSKLSETFDAKINLRDRHGKGRIEIHYEDYETLRKVLEVLELDIDVDL